MPVHCQHGLPGPATGTGPGRARSLVPVLLRRRSHWCTRCAGAALAPNPGDAAHLNIICGALEQRCGAVGSGAGKQRVQRYGWAAPMLAGGLPVRSPATLQRGCLIGAAAPPPAMLCCAVLPCVAARNKRAAARASCHRVRGRCWQAAGLSCSGNGCACAPTCSCQPLAASPLLPPGVSIIIGVGSAMDTLCGQVSIPWALTPPAACPVAGACPLICLLYRSPPCWRCEAHPWSHCDVRVATVPCRPTARGGTKRWAPSCNARSSSCCCLRCPSLRCTLRCPQPSSPAATHSLPWDGLAVVLSSAA